MPTRRAPGVFYLMPLAPFCCFGGSGCGLTMTRGPGPIMLLPAAIRADCCRTLGGSGCGLIETFAPGITVWAAVPIAIIVARSDRGTSARAGWAAIEAIAVALSAIARKLVAKKQDLRNMTISYG
jgi:hypothetical protein